MNDIDQRVVHHDDCQMTVSTPSFRAFPQTPVALAESTLNHIGVMVPESSFARISKVLAQTSIREVHAFGFEINPLTPNAPCDVGFLMTSLPSFVRDRHAPLIALTEGDGRASRPSWWEIDTEKEEPSISAFSSQMESATTGLDLLVRAAGAHEMLAHAAQTVTDITREMGIGMVNNVGLYPDRTDGAIAVAQVRLSSGELNVGYQRIRSQVSRSFDITDPRVETLLNHSDRISVAISADAHGETVLSLEGGLTHRNSLSTPSMWSRVFQGSEWAESREQLNVIVAAQRLTSFDSVPQTLALTTISHVKVGPGGKFKIYLGTYLYGHRVNRLSSN